MKIAGQRVNYVIRYSTDDTHGCVLFIESRVYRVIFTAINITFFIPLTFYLPGLKQIPDLREQKHIVDPCDPPF